MKKILLLCSVAFILSCSSESIENDTISSKESQSENSTKSVNSVNSETPPIENDIDQMFFNYVNSSIYSETQNAIVDFNTDLNWLAVEFDSSTEMLSWIGSNIDLTNFGSISNMQSKWSTIVNLKQQERDQFPQIFEFIENTDLNVSSLYLNKWLTSVRGNVKVELLIGCDQSYTNCKNSASAERNYGMDVLSGNSEGLAYVQNKYENKMERCKAIYDNCKK